MQLEMCVIQVCMVKVQGGVQVYTGVSADTAVDESSGVAEGVCRCRWRCRYR